MKLTFRTYISLRNVFITLQIASALLFCASIVAQCSGPLPGQGGGGGNPCGDSWASQCLANGGTPNSSNCSCIYPPSPIIIDTRSEGFHLTGVENGVLFTFFPGKPAIQMSWTDSAFSNGFLVLDRNHNGKIDDGTELFGNLSPQPPSLFPNGFAALAIFDRKDHGGNENGVIDPGDAVFSELRIWIDKNHNGISDPDELFTLSELGIERISLRYRESPYVDAEGNRFRYVAKIWDEDQRNAERCYDVFFLSAAATTLNQ